MGRVLVALNSLLGGLGLGTSLGYFVLVAAAFHPRGEAVTDFMVGASPDKLGFGFAVVILPYVFLTLHLWGRARLANVLVDRGDVALAEKYASRRLRTGLLRSKREALANRVALMRCAMREQDYARVEALRADAVLPKKPRVGTTPPELAMFHRWSLECALRRENLIDARAIVEDAWPMSASTAEVAAFAAAAAELAVRNDDHEAYLEWTERAAYAHASSARLDIVKCLAALRFAQVEPPTDVDPESWLQDVPGARLEFEVARQQLGGDPVSAAPDAADARSQHVFEAMTTPSD